MMLWKIEQYVSHEVWNNTVKWFICFKLYKDCLTVKRLFTYFNVYLNFQFLLKTFRLCSSLNTICCLLLKGGLIVLVLVWKVSVLIWKAGGWEMGAKLVSVIISFSFCPKIIVTMSLLQCGLPHKIDSSLSLWNWDLQVTTNNRMRVVTLSLLLPTPSLVEIEFERKSAIGASLGRRKRERN